MSIPKVGLVWHGDRESRLIADLAQSRFSKAACALSSVGLYPVPVVYNDDFADEVREQMLGLDALQVWVNPIEDGRDRTLLDQVLREASAAGVLVNTHPDTILKMGTKRVLFETRKEEFGSDVDIYDSVADLTRRLPSKLNGGPRVLKQMRGHSGGGIWKVEWVDSTHVKVRHAQRGSPEEVISLDSMVARMRPYFESGGAMIDQEFQARLSEGVTRVYMVGTKVGGFGHQAINALYPAPPNAAANEMPQPGPRLYYPPDQPEFQNLGLLMESRWVAKLQRACALGPADLPLLWDADFFLGPKNRAGEDTYVLCEINVSCVSPYPEWANPLLAETLRLRIDTRSIG